MKHEILFLNSKRTYVKVSDTWYDAHIETYPNVGDSFLYGKVEEVMDYNTYTETYPESKDEIFPHVIDKTNSGGWIRRVDDGLVRYAVNPQVPQIKEN